MTALLCLALPDPALADVPATASAVRLEIPREDLQAALVHLAQQAGIRSLVTELGNDVDVPNDIIVGPLNGTYTLEAALVELLADTNLTYKTNVNEGGPYLVLSRRTPDPKRKPDPPRRDPTPSPPSESTPVDPLEDVLVPAQRVVSPEPSQPNMMDPVINGEIAKPTNSSTTAEGLRYEVLQPYWYATGFRANGAQFFEPRGLGINSGVTLINKRWGGPTAANGGDAFNINLIAPTAIAYVESRFHGSSDQLGSHALDGLVDVVLDTSRTGLTAEINYGGARGGADERRLTLSAGDAEGNLKCSLLADYFTRDFLLGQERPLWNDQDFRRYGGIDWRTTNSNPGNVWSTRGNLPGLDAPFAAISQSDAGVASYRAGELNRDSGHQSMSIVPATSSLTILGSGELALSWATISGELLAIDSATVFQSTSPLLQRVLVPASNPFNDFDVPVLVSKRLDGVAARHVDTEETYVRAVLGARGDVGAGNWETAFVYSDEHGSQQSFNELDPIALQAALVASDPRSALDVFGDNSSSKPPSELIADPRRYNHSASGMQWTASLEGPLITRDAFKVKASLGGELRKEAVSFESWNVSASRTLAAAYLRSRLELTDPQITVDMEGRVDKYSDTAALFNPLFSVSWKLLSGLTLRSSYRTSARVPSLFDLTRPALVQSVPIVDPQRNGAISTPSVRIGGGNPRLEPARGESWTAGISLQPVENISLAANYWQLQIHDRSVTLPVSTMLANEALFSDYIRRDSTGALTFIDVSNLSLGRARASGIDITMAGILKTTDYGTFRGELSAKWFDDYVIEDIPGVLRTKRVGVASQFGTIPQWKGLASLGWQGTALGAKATLLYTAGYDDISLSRTTDHSISSQVILNLQATLDLTDPWQMPGLFQDMRFTVGIQNVTDESPGYAEVGGAAGFDLSEGDLRQRFVFFGISKRFK